MLQNHTQSLYIIYMHITQHNTKQNKKETEGTDVSH